MSQGPGRLSPAPSTDPERELIGMLTFSGDRAPELVRVAGGIIGPEEIARANYRALFRGMSELVEAGTPILPESLADYVASHGGWHDEFKGSGPSALPITDTGVLKAMLLESFNFAIRPTEHGVRYFAQQIRDAAQRRRLQKKLEAIPSPLDTTTPLQDFASLLLDAAYEAASADPSTWLSAPAGELAQSTVQPAAPLVDGLIFEGDRVNLFGDAGVGKGWIGLSIAMSIANGTPFAGRWACPAPHQVVCVFMEDRPLSGGLWPPRLLFRLRCLQLGIQERGLPTENLERGLHLICGLPPAGNFETALQRHVVPLAATVTLLDSLQSFFEGDENIRGDVERNFQMLDRNLAGWAVLDHERKGQPGTKDSDKDSQIGSGRKRQAVDTSIRVKAHPGVDGDLAVVLKPAKGRDGLDLPRDGVVIVFRGLPVDRKLPLDAPVPIVPEYVGEASSPQDLGAQAKEGKESRKNKLVEKLTECDGRMPVLQAATALGVDPKTVDVYVREDSRFESEGRGESRLVKLAKVPR